MKSAHETKGLIKYFILTMNNKIFHITKLYDILVKSLVLRENF